MHAPALDRRDLPQDLEHPSTLSRTVDWIRHRFPLQRASLGIVVALSALLNFIALGSEGYANTYYAAAVKSMSQSWHNFFFVAFDPGGFVSVDKPPLGLWLQVASTKFFGFSGVSLLIPQGIAAVLSVVVLYALITRILWSHGRPARCPITGSHAGCRSGQSQQHLRQRAHPLPAAQRLGSCRGR